VSVCVVQLQQDRHQLRVEREQFNGWKQEQTKDA
jgi:hypothetical protein